MTDSAPDHIDVGTPEDNLPPVVSSSPPLVLRTPLNIAGLILGVVWLVVPAAQYYGTYQRTAVLLDGAAPDSFARLDLTAIYVLLVGATVVLLALRYLLRDPSPTGDADRQTEVRA